MVSLALTGTKLLACLVLENLMNLRKCILLELVSFSETSDQLFFLTFQSLCLVILLRNLLNFLLDLTRFH